MATTSDGDDRGPANRNQLSSDKSKLSKPTSPLEDPVNVPPE